MVLCFVCFNPPALWSHVICDVLLPFGFPLSVLLLLPCSVPPFGGCFFPFLLCLFVCLCSSLSVSDRLFVCLFVCLLVCLFVCFFVSLFLCLFVCLFVRLFVCSFVRLFVCSYVRSFVCLFVRSFVCLFVCLFVAGLTRRSPVPSPGTHTRNRVGKREGPVDEETHARRVL